MKKVLILVSILLSSSSFSCTEADIDQALKNVEDVKRNFQVSMASKTALLNAQLNLNELTLCNDPNDVKNFIEYNKNIKEKAKIAKTMYNVGTRDSLSLAMAESLLNAQKQVCSTTAVQKYTRLAQTGLITTSDLKLVIESCQF